MKHKTRESVREAARLRVFASLSAGLVSAGAGVTAQVLGDPVNVGDRTYDPLFKYGYGSTYSGDFESGRFRREPITEVRIER